MDKAKRNAYMSKYYKIRIKREPWWVYWLNAKSRCSCKNRNWRKRGIKCLITLNEIKQLWFRDNAELLKIPSLDRIDNNGDYSFSNCRFIEHSENARLGNLGRKNKLGKYKTNVTPHALVMRRWREKNRLKNKL